MLRSLLPLVSLLLIAGCGTSEPTPSNPSAPPSVVCIGGTWDGSKCVREAPPACPPDTAWNGAQCERLQVAETTPPPAKVVVSTQSADLAAVRDSRSIQATNRSRPLVVTELQNLEALFASTDKASTDRPQLMRRLASGYEELGYIAVRDSAKATSPDEIAKLQKIKSAASQAAIKYYAMLDNQYPKFCANASANPQSSTGCNDEVLYYTGYLYERTGDLGSARKSYLKLIQNWPASKFVPFTYLAFAALFANEAESDPTKWALAKASAEEVVKYADSPAIPEALLILGLAARATSDDVTAEATFRKLRANYPDSGAAKRIP